MIEIYDIVDHDGKFPCHLHVTKLQEEAQDNEEHLVDDLELDADDVNADIVHRANHCVGALQFMNNSCKSSRDPVVRVQQSRAGRNPEVFENAAEFLGHHKTKNPRGLWIVQTFKDFLKKRKKK